MNAGKENEIIWQQVRKFWGHPSLNSPKYTTDGIMANEIAAIDMNSKNIMVNPENLEKRVGSELLQPVLGHEVGHYKLCPYSLRNFVRLVGHANSVLNNIEQAKFVENLFADLIVNYHLFKKGDHKIVNVYQNLSKDRGDKLWQFYIQTFADMIGKKPAGSSLSEKERKGAKRLSDILKKSATSSKRWPTSIKEFAKEVKKYLEQEPSNNPDQTSEAPTSGGGSENSQGDNKQDTKPVSTKSSTLRKLPTIDQHGVKDFLPYDANTTSPSEQKKVLEKELKGISSELGKDDFRKTVAGLGLAKDSQATIWFYRHLVDSYTVKMPNIPVRSGSIIKESPVRCELDDIHEADVEYSLSQFGILHPNYLYKWKNKEGRSGVLQDSAPDLLIVYDTSGSMPDPKTCVSFALLSAMIASDTALSNGNMVGVINFSSSHTYQPFTNQRDKIDDILTSYTGWGTKIPGERMCQMTKEHDYPSHVLIITDTLIQDLDRELPNLEEALRHGKSSGTIFLDSPVSDETKKLEKAGYEVVFTRSFEDLAELTLAKANEIYGR